MPRKAMLFACLLAVSACAYSKGIRPLHPLELATSLYSETVTSARTGSLMYEGGCLIFREDHSAAQFLPVWPDGSIFNGTSVIFHHPAKADQGILIGQEVLIEGQTVSWPALPPGEYASFRQQCHAPPFFVSRVRPAD